MKKLSKIALLLALTLGFSACGANSNESKNEESKEEKVQSEQVKEDSKDKEDNKEAKTIKVGVVGENNEVWEEVAKRYEEGTGNKVELVRFTDYNQPNEALISKDIDLNSYQHYKFLNEFNEKSGSNLVVIADTMLAPIGVYSNKIKDLNELEDGARIAIPDDATNGSRSLFLLQAAGLIKVKGNPGDSISLEDITENSKNIEFIEMDASQTARSLDDTDASVVNDNYALDSGLKPNQDAIYLEDAQSPDVKEYVNVIAARDEDKDKEEFKELVEYYQTDETKADYEKYTDGAWIPAW